MKRRYSFLALGIVLMLTTSGLAWATGSVEESAPESGARPGPGEIGTLIETGNPISSVARYATGFSAVENGDLTIVTVGRPWQAATADDALSYVLYPRSATRPEVDGAAAVIPVPIDSIVTMSTTFLAHLKALDRLDSLVAVDSVAFAYEPEVHAMYDAGELLEVGSGPGVDVEQLLALDADVIMVNSYGGEWDAQPALEQAGLPAVVSGDWVENAPLGRAEWLLFTALLFDELDEASDLFAEIEREYTRLTSVARRVQDDPSVLINTPYQGTWSISGGASYAARFIEDAGGAYVWSDDESTGALFLDIETVYAEAGDADVWINPGAWTSLAQGAAEDDRFTEFRAFREGRVYNNNRRMGPGGGNDYFESGALNPHIILNDLIWVFHPELVSDYEPYYYQQLQ
ncbi:MAG: ABC transporter substrate-binding protein [Spirochaetota bacterium]